MAIFSNTWRAVTGKLPDYRVWGRSSLTTFATDKSIDYTRNDYDLYRSLYYDVSINGKATEYLGGAMFVSPIINTTAGFALGTGYTYTIEEEQYKDQETAINQWLRDNEAKIYETFLHGLRDGDSYFYLDEYGNLEELDANTVSAVLDPVTGDIIGYDVIEKYDLSEVAEQRDTRVMVKQYRTNSVKYTEYKENEYNSGNTKKGVVKYYKVYTTQGTITPAENQMFYAEELVNRPLPIIHYANEPEPRQIYGNSELLKLLIGLRNYTAILSNATKGVIYNSNPIPYMKGVKDSSQVARQSNSGETEDTDKINWSPESIIFLENPESEAGYIQANGFMADTGQLLEYYFYLIVEASETPEFVFGTAVSSSKASVSEQMPVVIQKATRKRNSMRPTILALINSYIDRRIRMSDPVYLPLNNKKYKDNIEFPDLQDEDKALTLQTVQYLTDAGIITSETALNLLMAEKIPDIAKEIELAKKESEEIAKANQALPEELNRLKDEFNTTNQEKANDESKPTNTK